MRFQVPQFIDVEDKIFGPLTIKQFVYLAGGVGVLVVFITLLPKFLAFVLAAPFIALSIALAFYKPNNQPFVLQLEAMIRYFFGEKLYIWKEIPKKKNKNKKNPSTPVELLVPHLSNSKLKDLTWSLDVRKAEENDKTSGA